MSSARGTGRATIRDVAAEAGVSTGLVSLAFKDPARVSAVRRARILDAADRLGYRPNFVARSLAADGSSFIGILLSDLHNPLFAEIADAARQEFDAHGSYALIASATKARPEGRAPENPEEGGQAGSGASARGPGGLRVPGATGGADRIADEQVIAMFRDLRPRGVLVIGTIADTALLSGLPSATPVVYASAVSPEGSAHPSVRADDDAGMALLFDHLTGRGHQRIAFVGGAGGEVSRLRLEAYLAQAEARGMPALVARADFSEQSGYRAGAELAGLDPRPTAVIAVNDLAGIGVQAAAEQAGLRLPADLAVAAFDNTYLAGLHRISLTTIDPRNAEVGRRAASRLLLALDPDGARHAGLPRDGARNASAPGAGDSDALRDVSSPIGESRGAASAPRSARFGGAHAVASPGTEDVLVRPELIVRDSA
ncbi:LacI family DNA-binding transcriptional regulator [Sediminivirga luteola]|nr:LacI family DNA-binding transcriptional regulator [Sediminivirga luteola]